MTKPRVSSTYHFLNEEEFNNIPQDILDAASEEGKKKHKLIQQNWNTDLDHPIVNMFREGLAKVREWVSENSPGYTIVIDYKFTRDRLRPETAIQLVDYSGLVAEVGEISPGRIAIEVQLNGSRYTGKPDFVVQDSFAHFEHFAFHYHQDGGLFIYRIPDRSIEPLRKFGLSLVEHYDAIQEGRQIKYLKIAEWEKLQREYEVFEPFYSTMPPLEITTPEQANMAALKYCTDVKRFEERCKQLKQELTRYMEENGITKLWDPTGGGVRLQISNRKTYDSDKLKAFKETIITGTQESKSLVRFNPPVKKQKLLN